MINIISYDLVVKLKEEISQRNFKVVIVDESHFLKSYNSKRTNTIKPIIKVY